MHLTHVAGQANKSTHEVIAPNKLTKQELLWDFYQAKKY